jgi:hypothetical protein
VAAAPWRDAFTALLAGAPVAESGAVGPVLDRLAGLRHWLDHGVMPWWAPADLAPVALAELTVLQARLLFADGGAAENRAEGQAERAAMRLRRAVDHLGEAAGLQRLAPFVSAAAGPLAAVLRDAPVTAHEDIRLRALAAAVTGSPLDPAWLALPVPKPATVPAAMQVEAAGTALARAEETPPALRPDDRVRLLAWLAEPDEDLPVRLIRLLAALADAGDKMLDAALLAGLPRNSARDRWARALPDEALGRVLQRLAPARAHALLAAMTVLAAAWRQLAPLAPAGLPWASLLSVLADVGAADARTLITRLVGAMAADDPDALSRLRDRALAIARQTGAVGVVAALQPDAAPSAAPGDRPGGAPGGASQEAEPETSGDTPRETSGDALRETSGDTPREASGDTPREASGDTPREASGDTPRETSGDTPRWGSKRASGEASPETREAASRAPPLEASRRTSSEAVRQTSRKPSRDRPAAPPVEPDTTLYIGNAGLVLFNPFLPLFFERLGLLSPADGRPRIAGLEVASRAVHLLQYLVDQRCDRAEPALVLNKLLCGLAPADPILPAIAPSEPELAVCAAVTRALIDNWTAIRNAAPDGVRETFLQRDGRLSRAADRWELQVQRKTVDALTDLIPWNRSVVYHRWMEGAVYVTW